MTQAASDLAGIAELQPIPVPHTDMVGPMGMAAQQGRTGVAHAAPPHSPAAGRDEHEAELQRLHGEIERARSILRSAVEGAIVVLDLDGIITGWNEDACTLLGHAEAEVVGRSGDIILLPEDRVGGTFPAELGRAAVLGRVTSENWHLRRDGTRLWASRIVTPLRDANGQACGFLNILRDRTGSEPRRNDADARSLDSSPAPADSLAMFPDILSKVFSAPMSAVSFVEKDRQWFRAGVGLEVTETPIEQSFCAHAIQQPNEVLYVPDARLDPRFAQNPLVTGEMGLRFYAGMPIVSPGGTAIGALCVMDRVPRQVDDALLDQLRSLAAGVNAALRLEAAAEGLRRRDTESKLTQAMLVSVFQSVDAAVIVTRISGAILLFNAQCQDLLGYRQEELARLNLQDIMAAEQRDALAAADTAKLAGMPYRLDSAVRCSDGTSVPVRLTVALVERRDVPPFRVTTLHRKEVAGPAAKARHSSVMGCIQFLGLESVKAAYGPKWDSVRSGLLMAVERILKRRLSPDDVYTRTDDDVFSVWFKNGDEDDNAAQIARIRREIQITLLSELGGETTASVAAYTEVVEIDDPKAPQGEIMQGLVKRVAERRRMAEQTARALVEQVTNDQPRESIPVHGKNGAPIKASFTDLPRSLRGRFSGAMSLVGGQNAEIDTELLRLSVVSDAVMDDIAEGQNRTQFITMPVGLFIAKRGREGFLAQWEAMPPTVGAQIFVLLSDLPPDMGQPRLFEAVRVLKPIMRGVGVMLDQIDVLPFQPQASSLTMVGLCSDSVGSLPDVKLSSFILRMHQAKIPVLVRLAEGETARRWTQLGADFTTFA